MAETGIIILTLLAMMAVGFPLRAAFRRLGVPPAISLMFLGVLAGSGVLGLFPDIYLNTATADVDGGHPADAAKYFSMAALVILLLRAGLGLEWRTIRRVLSPALVFGVVPVAAEWIAVACGARFLLSLDWGISFLAGGLIAAVSPAVVLPTMIRLKDMGRGRSHLVPDRIIGQTIVNALIAHAGILLLVDLIAPPQGYGGPWGPLVLFLPAIIAGILLGMLVGRFLPLGGLGKRHPEGARLYVLAALMVAGCVGLYFALDKTPLEYVLVLAVLSAGVAFRMRMGDATRSVQGALQQVWLFAEVVLFVNLGAQINVSRLSMGDLLVALLGVVLLGLVVRLVVAGLLVRKSTLPRPARLYTLAAHVPKATIQAVFAAYPLQKFRERGYLDLNPEGDTLILLAVMAVVLTAPVGAVLLERWGGKMLEDSEESNA